LKPDGTKMFMIGSGKKTIYEYSLKEPWTLGTGTRGSVHGSLDFVQSSSIQFKGGTGEDKPRGIDFNLDGTRC
jgi:hypothetical protein